MQRQVVTKGMAILSILVTNIDVVKIEEEGIEVASFDNLRCSIVEVVGMEDNRVGVVVESSEMLVGL